MADYLAKIKLLVEGVQSLDKVEAKVKEIHRLTAGGWRVDLQGSEEVKKLTKDLDDVAKKGRTAAKALQDSFKNVGTIGKGAGIAGVILAVNQFGAALEAASAKAGLFSPAVQIVGSSVKNAIPGVDALVQAFTALPPALQATAPALAAVTAGLIAFNAPIRTAISDTVAVVKALNPVKEAIKTAFNTTLLMAFADTLEMNINAVENYRGSLLRLTDTVGDLSRRKAALQAALNNTNSSTDTAVKIAGKLVDVTKRLNEEQRAQNDLLREARGLSQSTLEESKAVKSLATKRRREAYLEDVAQGVDAALQAAADLDQELVNLDKHLADLDTAAAERRWQALEQQWKDADAAGAALVARMDEIRSKEAAASLKARGGKEPMPFDTGGVVRRTIAGPAYTEPAGPGVAGVSRGSAVAAEAALRKNMVVAGFQTLTYAQKEAAAAKITLETRYNWARTLAQGAEISDDLVRLSAEDAENAQLTLRAKRTEAKLQEAIARNRKKANELDEKTARKKQTRTDVSSAVIGGAFPLLFGQGIGASFGGAVGGGLGARFGGQGGFAGSLVGTFAGQATVDFAINSAVQLGTALRKPTENIKELTKFLGIAGTQLDANITVLQNLGMESSASAVALAKLEDILKAEGYKNIDTLSKQLTDLENAFSRLKLAAANLLSEPLTDFLNWLTDTIKLVSRAGGVGGFITTSPEQLQAMDRQIQSERRAATQTAETPGAAELAAQKLISQEEQRQLDLAGAQVQLERQRMSLTRVELASKQGSIELLRITNDLEKKSVELNNAKEKSKRMQLQLDVKLLQQQQAQAEAARQNAIIEAQRQVQRELFGLYNQQYGVQQEIGKLSVERIGLIDGELAGIKAAQKELKAEEELRRYILYYQREAALIGINEQDIREEIINLYEGLNQQLVIEIGNRTKTLKQQEAEYNLTRLQVGQQRELNRLQQENQAEQQLRELTSGVDSRFMGLFGGSRRTQSLMQAEFETRSNELRAQLAAIEQQKLVPDIKPGTLQRLQDQEKELKNTLAVYTEYQPAIIAATVAQERFNEALAITSPLVDSVFDGITNVVTGTQTAQEAFASFLNTVGQMLLDTAKQMIAQYIALGIAKVFAFGNSGFSFSGAGPVAMPGAGVGGGSSMFMPGAPSFFAEGGFVTGPTRALIGEGGESEYVIPASKMRSAMARYAGGARGAAVIPGNGEGGGGSGGAPAGTIDVRYSIERINNVDYVTADQFQRGMAQAAEQGAIQGERRAMRTLGNSPATRRRIGI